MVENRIGNRIEIEIPIKAMGKERPRVTKNGTFTSKKTKAYEFFIGRYLFARGIRPVDYPVRLTVLFFFTKPRSAPRSRILPSVKPDLDNLLKAILDAGNQILYEDDNQICSIISKKLYGPKNSIKIVREKMIDI